MTDKWRYYLPDRGATVDDAKALYGIAPGEKPEIAAEEACEDHYAECESGLDFDVEFSIVIVAPDGAEHRFIGIHEVSIQHLTRRAP